MGAKVCVLALVWGVHVGALEDVGHADEHWADAAVPRFVLVC